MEFEFKFKVRIKFKALEERGADFVDHLSKPDRKEEREVGAGTEKKSTTIDYFCMFLRSALPISFWQVVKNKMYDAGGSCDN